MGLKKRKSNFFHCVTKFRVQGCAAAAAAVAVATVTVAGDDLRVTEGETETKEELKP